MADLLFRARAMHPPIRAGLNWSVRITNTQGDLDPFPSGSTYEAEARAPGAAAVLAEPTVTRLDDTTIEIGINASQATALVGGLTLTATPEGLRAGRCLIEITRTDGAAEYVMTLRPTVLAPGAA